MAKRGDGKMRAISRKQVNLILREELVRLGHSRNIDLERGCRILASVHDVALGAPNDTSGIGIRRKCEIASKILGVDVLTAKAARTAGKAIVRRVREEMRAKLAAVAPTQAMIDAFYASWEWKRLRYEFLRDKARRCVCCGRTPDHGIAIHVDHIKPIRRYWAFRLSGSNLQVLCDDCNRGKGSHDETDWREFHGDIVFQVLDGGRS